MNKAPECAVKCQGYSLDFCCGEFCERLAKQGAKTVSPILGKRGVSIDNPRPDQPSTTTGTASSLPEDWILKAMGLAREVRITGDSDPLIRHLLAQEELHRQQLQNEFTAGEDSGRTEVELFYKGIEA
jgi:hypothetical protein